MFNQSETQNNQEQQVQIEQKQIEATPQGIVCPLCGYLRTEELEIEFINDMGMCANCDHNSYDLDLDFEGDTDEE